MTGPGAETVTTIRRETAMQDLRTLFDLGIVSGLSDSQLIDRFLTRGGEAAERAFAMLVERHGPMVLRVCGNILSAPHDVEDALQATFLILLRKAGTIRDRTSCASWLHGVALRAAAGIRTADARRRSHERRVARGVNEVSAGDGAGSPDELRGVIDQELGRLRAQYRSPLVLCYLEGLSCEEAACRLGWPVGTVKSRLARGRGRLRDRLVRRGLVPTAAIGLPAPSRATVPPALAAKVVAEAERVMAGASSGLACSPAVASRVRSELRRGWVLRSAWVATALVAVGLVASAAALASREQGRAVATPVLARVAEPEPDAGPIHARVIDRDGKGVAGTEVRVFGKAIRARVVTTDDDGRVLIPRDAVDDQISLVATRGDALGWASRYFLGHPGQPRAANGSGTAADPIVLTLLPRSREVTGSILDSKGGPIAGVRVIVRILDHAGHSTGYLVPGQLEPEGWPLGSTITDERGRYTLRLPERTASSMWASHRQFVGPMIAVSEDARALEPVRMEPAGGVTGRVTDATTGEPVAGVRLGAQILDHHEKILNGGGGDALSDAQGRFLIGGLEPGVYNVLFDRPADRDKATARAAEAVRVRLGENATVDLRMIEGRPLRGIVIDAQTGRPAAGVLVGCYGPAHPRSGAEVESRRTDEQGRFTFYVPPGEQYVYVMDGSSFGRVGRSVVDVPERGEAEPVRLIRNADGGNRPAFALEAIKKEAVTIEKKVAGPNPAAPAEESPPGRTVTGRVRDPQGRPLAGVEVYLALEHMPDRREALRRFDSAATDRDGVFVLAGLPPVELRINLHLAGRRVETKTLAADRTTVDFEYAARPDAGSSHRPKPPEDAPIAPALKDRLTFVDLDPRGNEFLADGPGGTGNDLARLPRGRHELGTTFFRVGEKMVHLRGRRADNLPDSTNAIVAGARADKLHFLHAAQQAEPPGTEVGAYVVRYADGTSERIPVLYGRDLANWWAFPNAEPDITTTATIAWSGENDTTDLNRGIKIRLFEMTWINPHPDRTIATIDVLSKATDCDPFVVAITLERGPSGGRKQP